MILSQNNEYAALLDACVLIPTLCDTLLRLAEHPAFYRPLWSELILEEVGTALETKLGYTDEQAQRRLTVMRREFPESLVSLPKRLDSFNCPDEKDRHVLAAAVRGQANAIVTSNIKHFPSECIEEYGLLCQSPDEFLENQFHLDPPMLIEKLDQQAAARNRTRMELIEKLAPICPGFAKIVREYSI